MKAVIKLFLICICFAAISCKKQLEITPLSVLDETSALKTVSGVEGAITSVYSNLKSQSSYGRDMIAIPECLADNVRNSIHSNRLVGETSNANGFHFVNWGNCYNSINNANLIMDAVAATSATITPTPTAADVNNWVGQLKFLRALNYFDLVREYSYIPGAVVAANDKGGVPLMLTGIRTSELASTAKPTRGSIAGVYTQIYADLNDAIAKLPATSTQFPFRATKVAAQALLARVALYNKDYATAKANADLVITARGTTLLTPANYVAGWRAAINPESIFEVAFATSGESLGVNTSMQSTFTSLAAPGGGTGGWGDACTSISLINDLGITLAAPASYGITNCNVASRSSDVRNLLYEPGSTGRGLTFIECTKYMGKNGALYTDNIPVLRISDMYLIRAEALSSDPASPVYNLTNAIADLNLIRTNRGIAVTAATTQPQVIADIIAQRRLEFAFEGHRFFDLKRLGKDIFKSPSYSDILFNDFRILPPIPTSDISLNPNIIQNTNY
jgi:starch-binding outer membrane protein, SusD/RagB family